MVRLFGFNGISTLGGYLMQNPVYIRLLNESFAGNFIFKRVAAQIFPSIAIVCTRLNGFKCCYLTLIILFRLNNNHHHHHVVPPVLISLTLSRHFSLWFIASGRSSGLHPVSSHSYCMCVRAGRPAFAWPYAGVHWSISLMSSSLLLQQCPACLVRLTCIVFVMRSKWSYSWCLAGCCRQDLFNIALNILEQLSSSFFFSRLVSVQVVHPYSSIDTTAAWKKLRFILSVRLNNSIWTIKWTRTCTTTLARVELEIMVIKRYSTFLKAPRLVSQHLIVYSHI